jgi:hypothetical protein
MASAFSALSDFIKSIFELIASMFQTFFGLIETFVKLVVNFFTSIVELFGDTTKGVFNVLGGVGNFFIGKSPAPHLKLGVLCWADVWFCSQRSGHRYCSCGGLWILGLSEETGTACCCAGEEVELGDHLRRLDRNDMRDEYVYQQEGYG